MGQSGLTPETLAAGLLSIREPALSPDGCTFAFTMAAGGRQHVFTMAAAGSLPRQITTGIHGFAHLAWAPDGSRIAAVSRGGIWVMDPDGRELRCISRHVGGDDWPTWWPDGSRILFSSRRRGWTQWFSLPADGAGEAVRHTAGPRDFAHADISPDGQTLAYDSRCRDNPDRCEVWIVPAAGGEARCLTPPGDVWEVSPKWTADGQLIVVSETPEDGWARLTRLSPADPDERTPLTDGPYEDLPLRPSPRGERMAYLRVVEGAHELYVAGADGGGGRKVACEPAFLDVVGFSADGRAVFVLRRTPVEVPHLARIDVASGACEPVTQPNFPGLRCSDLVLPERVHYRNREGDEIEAWLWTPPPVAAGDDGGAPLLVHAHGGPHGFNRYDWNARHQLLVANGYGILAPDFRGSTGHGRRHRQGHYRRWGEADTDDLVDGAAWAVENLAWVSRDRLGIVGGSYGGYMVHTAVTRHPDVFRCAVASSGDSDIYESYQHGDRPGRLDLWQQMGDPEANRRLYRDASPLFRAEDIETPLLVLHGTEDRSVVPLMAQLMEEALRGQKKLYEIKWYEGKGHGGGTAEQNLDAIERTLRFLDLHLKRDGQDIPAPHAAGSD